MNKNFLLFLMCWPAFAGHHKLTITPEQAAAKLAAVELSLSETGLAGRVRLSLYPDGTVVGFPVLYDTGEDEMWKTLQDSSQWQRDSDARAEEKEAIACFRHIQAEIGSLHVCQVAGAHYVFHDDWHYSGWKHPVSAAKHVLGECWAHKLLGLQTNYVRLLAAMKKRPRLDLTTKSQYQRFLTVSSSPAIFAGLPDGFFVAIIILKIKMTHQRVIGCRY